ncbi:hypothetical protein P8452_48803 [Trifolium repens]|nr:hypothetical protein P8452_48803 [Trifolium repens]
MALFSPAPPRLRYHSHVFPDPNYNRFRGHHTFPRWALILVVALAIAVAVIITLPVIIYLHRRRSSSATPELDLSAPARYDTASAPAPPV